jgi:ketol-acid reductoisomerase
MYQVHGLTVHFNLIEPRADLDVADDRTKGPATLCVLNTSAALACRVSLRIHADASGQCP